MVVGRDQSSAAHDDDNAPCPFSLVASATTCEVPISPAQQCLRRTFEYLSASTFVSALFTPIVTALSSLTNIDHK